MPAVSTSLAEYLATNYHPDRDYVDGELQECNSGEFEHAAVQAFLTGWFFQHRVEWHLRILQEMRIKVAPSRVRVADVCLVSRAERVEQVITKPPLAVVEIVAPDDRVQRYNERLADYRRLGVGHVWVIDSANKMGYDCGTAAWLPVDEFPIPQSAASMRLNDLWDDLESNR